MSTTRIKDTDYADVALYDKVNQIADEIDAEVESKQPKLIAGENVIIQGNTISAKGGALGDEITVITTEDDKAQAIGVIEKNKSKPKYDWVGTLAEYQSQAVATNHPDWVCYITDDNTADAYEAYSKTETDELLNGVEDVVDKKLDDKHRTNCITEIPQDIKLELVDGTLTLKAGSKVWIPYGTTEAYQVGDTDAYNHTVVDTSWNGSKFFYAIEITSDVETIGVDNAATWFVCLRLSDGTPTVNWLQNCKSGSDSSEFEYCFGYNTTDNTIFDYRDVKSFQASLPLAIVTSNSTEFTAIDQTFNGFGYIGSTVFALPGVKGLIPNGRNADGSLKNTEFVTDKVLLETATTYKDFPDIFVGQPGLFNNNFLGSFKSAPQIVNYSYYYNESENMIYGTGNEGKWSIENRYIYVGSVIGSTSISSLTSKTTFQAVDRNDSSWLSGLGMPSNKVVNLTLGASGSTYTMPATGWLKIDKSADDQRYLYVGVFNGVAFTLSSSGVQGLCATIPVKKNDIVSISYNANRETNSFVFIYAEGSL